MIKGREERVDIKRSLGSSEVTKSIYVCIYFIRTVERVGLFVCLVS